MPGPGSAGAAGLAWILAAAALAACSGPGSVPPPRPGPAPTHVPAPPAATGASPASRARELGTRLAQEPQDALVGLAELGVASADDGEVRQAVMDAVAGWEAPFFGEALGRSMRTARDVGPLLREVARTVGGTGWSPDAAWVIQETANRSCCVRRSFLAESLEGLADGLEAAGAGAGTGGPGSVDAAVERQLRTLGAIPDPEVAGAARRLEALLGLGPAAGSSPVREPR